MSKVKGKEYELAVRIAGIVDKNFDVSLQAAAAKTRNFANTINTMDTGFAKISSAAKKCFDVVATAAEVAAVAVGGIAIASSKVGSDFESAFAGVKKTVDETAAEAVGGYETLRKDILDMALVIPEAATDIAGAMEIAGQLGIEPEALTDFTKTMMMISTSTNLGAEEAATALARFANITNMENYGEDGISNFERLGSVIVDLGNNFATTEEEIVRTATNLSATGEMIGFTESEILAYATAMSSVGVKAEKGGTAVSKLLRKIQLAVETDSDALGDYAHAAGMSIEEFKYIFQTDAVQAVTAFIDGIGDVERNGKSAIAVLDEMGIKEARMTDVILRLSSADNLLIDALETADEAWEKNTALSEEANKRYETFESQITLLMNAFKNLGISIYDNLTRSPLLEWITAAKEGINDFTKHSLPGIVNKIKTTLPTIQRKLKPVWDIVSSLFDAVKWTFKFVIDNSAAVIGVIAGIGTALVTYKIVSSITHIVTALTALTSNPMMIAISGIIVAIGAVAGAFTAYKIAQQQAIDQDLADHFGNIALSMRDIEKVATHIVESHALVGLRDSLSEFAELETLSDEVKLAIDEINKMNWKVSIGMELSEEEEDSYKAAIETYVNKVQEYALQSRYAVSINLETFITEDDLENSNIVQKVDRFYADKYTELENIGKRLGLAVTSAFNDGLLEIDEINVIAGLQSQMAEIQKQLAVGELDAALALMTKKYSGAMLTSDSFKNLQDELAKQTADAVSVYEDAYKRGYAAISASHSGGYLTDSEYESAISAINNTLNEDIAKTLIRSTSFQLNTINDAYGSEVEQFRKTVQDTLDKYSDPQYAYDWSFKPNLVWNDMLTEIMQGGPNNTSKMAIEQLLDTMTETINKLNALPKMSNEELQNEVDSVIQTVELLQAITARQDGLDFAGSVNDLYEFLTNFVTENGKGEMLDYILGQSKDNTIKTFIDYYQEKGWPRVKSDTFKTFIDYYREADHEFAQLEIAEAEAAAENIVTHFMDKIHDLMDNVEIVVHPSLKPMPIYSGFNMFDPFRGISHHANGGLVNDTELSWLAERGPEMVVPLDGSRNAISLWEKTGMLLGMQGSLDKYDLSSGGGAEIVYSPTLQFYGDAPSKSDLEEALSISQDEFDAMMDKYMKNKRRKSFAF